MTSEGASGNPASTTLPLLHERYELGERLAEGSFFRTHRGRDIQTGRPVAIKVLRPEFAGDEAFCERLLSEARSVAQLKDPHVAQMHDAWRERGTIVLITEWVPGINLKDRIRRVAPFPMAVALDIMLACAQALRHAHESGVIHGDVRPDNIIITPDGRVKLTDFGVGVSGAASQRVQLNSLPRGAYYLAPETVEGRMPSVRSDLYALGCILYEMLAGVVPFDAETPMAVAAKHLHAPPPTLRKANPAVPQAVEGIALKCMQKDPAARYGSAAQLIADIEAVREAMRNDQSLNWSPMQEAAPAETEPVAKPRKPAPAPVAARPEPRREVRHEDTGPSFKLLLGVALLAIIMGLACFGVVSMLTRAPGQVMVPDGLVNVSESQAVAMLQQAGLKAEIHREFSEKVSPGTVYQALPPARTELRAGKSVQLYVSQGSEPTKVPDVTGKKLDDARRALQAAELSVGAVREEFSEIVNKGMVLSQTPVGGTETGKQAAVALTVSKGPEPVTPTPGDNGDNGGDNGGNNPDNGGNNPPDSGAPTAPAGTANPGTATPAAPAPSTVPSPDLPPRDHEVDVHVPRGGNGPQHVKIVVRNEDGSEQVAYENDHQPGEDFTQTVTTFGGKGKCEIRVTIGSKTIRNKV